MYGISSPKELAATLHANALAFFGLSYASTAATPAAAGASTSGLGVAPDEAPAGSVGSAAAASTPAPAPAPEEVERTQGDEETQGDERATCSWEDEEAVDREGGEGTSGVGDEEGGETSPSKATTTAAGGKEGGAPRRGPAAAAPEGRSVKVAARNFLPATAPGTPPPRVTYACRHCRSTLFRWEHSNLILDWRAGEWVGEPGFDVCFDEAWAVGCSGRAPWCHCGHYCSCCVLSVSL